MAIFEATSRLSRRYLMRKSKCQLCRLAIDYGAILGMLCEYMSKYDIATKILEAASRMPDEKSAK